MLRLSRNALMALALGVLAFGCTSATKPGERLIKQRIAFFNEMAAEYEKVTDKASFDAASIATEALGEKHKITEDEWNALSEADREAAIRTHKVEYDRAWARFGTAKQAAKQKARS